MNDLVPVSGDVGLLKQAFGCFPSGVSAICALAEGKPVGMVVSSFTTVSLRPPLVSVCIQDTSTTWPRLRTQPRLGLSILAETQDEMCLRLSKAHEDRFGSEGWEVGAEGGVFVQGASAWLECSVFEEYPAGDHYVALLEVHKLRPEPETPPLIFHASRFRRLMAT
jgi:flavin reductase (DIM6/NTAB) family NADH-FMN oxidoreductase RutF